MRGGQSQPISSVNLPCGSIVYRAARKRWVQQVEGVDVILSDAFLLRPGENGLSVCLSDTVTPQQCANRLSGCKSVLSLHVGRIRNIGLDVIADTPEHAEIRGLPDSKTNPADAERFAGLVAQQARVVRV